MAPGERNVKMDAVYFQFRPIRAKLEVAAPHTGALRKTKRDTGPRVRFGEPGHAKNRQDGNKPQCVS